MAYVPDEAIDRMDELSGGAYKLYTYLCKRRNGKLGNCFPKLRRAAADIKRDHVQVWRWRKELIERGWILFDQETDVWTPLVGFPPVDETTTESLSKPQRRVVKSTTASVDVSSMVHCENNNGINKTEPAHEPKEKSSSRAALSRFSLEECRKYVLSEAPHAREPGALARFLHKNGEDDDKMAAFFERGGRKETIHEYSLRIAAIAANLSNSRNH
jgi:hypothetical protein